MRLLLAAVVLILFPRAPSIAQEWIEYDSRTDFFNVNFPGPPDVKNITYTSEFAITLPARVHTAAVGPDRYSVTVVDYTDIRRRHAEMVKRCQTTGGDGDQCVERSATDLRGAIAYATWHFLQREARLTHFVYTQADRVEGHELHQTNPDGSHTLSAIYMHENRLYILEATVPAASPPPLLFHQSMRFLDNEGKSVRYQSTYSNGFPPPPRER
jgi:hypothetical protein